MILIRLMGGLGNQLFQLSLALRLADAGRQVSLDTSFLNRHLPGSTARQYALGDYPHRLPCSTTSQRLRVGWDLPTMRRIRDVLDERRAWPRRRLIKERTPFRWDEQVLSVRQGLLMGYWQHEEYLNWPKSGMPLKQLLRIDLETAGLDPGLVARISQESAAVAVHVRRGDYVQQATTEAYHGSCGTAYFEAAIEVVRKSVPQAHFFIFSNDPAWCAENLHGEGMTTVSTVNSRPQVDLELMSRCRHHIISNSTLSWWSAWLGEQPGSITIAPDPWLRADPEASRNLIPARWQRVSA